MKRKVALGALLVLGGLVSLGALLMWGVFDSAPGASATDIHPLIVKIGPDPVWDDIVGCDDCEVVGNVYLNRCQDAPLQVVFTPTTVNMLDEVHACVATHELPWLPPGSESKCERAGGYFGAAECDAGICTIEITANGGLQCGARVFVQAHAAMEDGQTAYGEEWKGGFWADISCCWCD
jgi:hypothetical protein